MWQGRGARVSDFFAKNPSLKQKKFRGGGAGGRLVGGRWGSSK